MLNPDNLPLQYYALCWLISIFALWREKRKFAKPKRNKRNKKQYLRIRYR
jgi:hypothetical protein